MMENRKTQEQWYCSGKSSRLLFSELLAKFSTATVNTSVVRGDGLNPSYTLGHLLSVLFEVNRPEKNNEADVTFRFAIMSAVEGVVRLPSFPHSSFRYSVRRNEASEPVLWLESRKTREQWYNPLSNPANKTFVGSHVVAWRRGRACTVKDTKANEIPRDTAVDFLVVS